MPNYSDHPSLMNVQFVSFSNSLREILHLIKRHVDLVQMFTQQGRS